MKIEFHYLHVATETKICTITGFMKLRNLDLKRAHVYRQNSVFACKQFLETD